MKYKGILNGILVGFAAGVITYIAFYINHKQNRNQEENDITKWSASLDGLRNTENPDSRTQPKRILRKHGLYSSGIEDFGEYEKGFSLN